MSTTLEMLVEQARNGDKNALEGIIRGIQDLIYGLAIRGRGLGGHLKSISNSNEARSTF